MLHKRSKYHIHRAHRRDTRLHHFLLSVPGRRGSDFNTTDVLDRRTTGAATVAFLLACGRLETPTLKRSRIHDYVSRLRQPVHISKAQKLPRTPPKQLCLFQDINKVKSIYRPQTTPTLVEAADALAITGSEDLARHLLNLVWPPHGHSHVFMSLTCHFTSRSHFTRILKVASWLSIYGND
jgi:hypothetical protein